MLAPSSAYVACAVLPAAPSSPTRPRPHSTSHLPNLAARLGLPSVAHVARGVPRACSSRPPSAATRRHAPPPVIY